MGKNVQVEGIVGCGPLHQFISQLILEESAKAATTSPEPLSIMSPRLMPVGALVPLGAGGATDEVAGGGGATAEVEGGGGATAEVEGEGGPTGGIEEADAGVGNEYTLLAFVVDGKGVGELYKVVVVVVSQIVV